MGNYKIIYDNMNVRFKIVPRDSTGNAIPAHEVQEIDVVLYNEYNSEVWLQFNYPGTSDKEDITLESGEFWVEITTALMGTLPTGNILVLVHYKIENQNYTEGFKADTKKGRIFIAKDIPV